MKVLVTGHCGFIGKKIFDLLESQGHHVLGIDLKQGKDIFYSLPNENFDFVFHLAAFPSVEFCNNNPFYSMNNNVLGTSKILEWSRSHGVKRVVFSSSAAVNDGNPQSPYGLQKYISELECKMYSKMYRLDTVCLRYFNVYSEDQKYGGAYSSVISAWMEMIRQGKPLRIDGDGSQTRDLIHVDDIVSANIFCMNHLENFNGESVNIATGRSVSLAHIKNFIDKHHKVQWLQSPSRNGDIKHSIADINFITNLGWSPSISIDEGLARCFKKDN